MVTEPLHVLQYGVQSLQCGLTIGNWAVQELQAEQRQLIELTRKSADQQLRDDLEALKSEIVRLKDKEQRDVDAQAALDALKDNIEELNANISMVRNSILVW